MPNKPNQQADQPPKSPRRRTRSPKGEYTGKNETAWEAEELETTLPKKIDHTIKPKISTWSEVDAGLHSQQQRLRPRLNTVKIIEH
jgi:hypothetical protein